MIRGIDTQMMVQQSVNTSRVAGEHVQRLEHQEDFKAQIEREILTEEAEQVLETEKTDFRAVEREKNEKENPEDRKAMLPYRGKREESEGQDRGGMSEIEERAAEKMKVNVGVEIDISV